MPSESTPEAPGLPSVLAGISGAQRSRLRPGPHPSWVDPTLATLTDRPFSGDQWIFERKLDGVRCLAFRHGGEVKLLSRKKQRLENTYPEIVDQLESQSEDDFVLDGEVVAFEGGRTSFALLQQRSGITDPRRARSSPVKVSYYVFDLLYLSGYDTRALPLTTRKALLKKVIAFREPLKFTVHRRSSGESYFEWACAHGWEGLIAKRADAAYASRRSSTWLKLKCQARQEFVIGGFTEPSGTRIGFGALLLGYYERGRLLYAGKVGTGFDDRMLHELRRRLDSLETAGSPFSGTRRFERGTHFVRSSLVAEVGFTEWTRDGMLRHPRFVGLREDKAAQEVTREIPSR